MVATSQSIESNWLVYWSSTDYLKIQTGELKESVLVTYSLTGKIEAYATYKLVFQVELLDEDPTEPYHIKEPSPYGGLEDVNQVTNQTTLGEYVNGQWIPFNETNSTYEKNETTSSGVETNSTDFLFLWYKKQARNYSANAKPVIPSIEGISQTGVLTIVFNKDMLIENNFYRSNLSDTS